MAIAGGFEGQEAGMAADPAEGDAPGEDGLGDAAAAGFLAVVLGFGLNTVLARTNETPAIRRNTRTRY
jgi:hypothetical protein